jgi:DNA-binding protein H-NS
VPQRLASRHGAKTKNNLAKKHVPQKTLKMGSGPSAPLSPVRLDPAFLQKVVTFLHAHSGEKEFTKHDSNKEVAKTMHATYCVVPDTNGKCSSGVDVNDPEGFMTQVVNLASSIAAYSVRLENETIDNNKKASALARQADNVKTLIHLIQAHEGIGADINKQIENMNGSALKDAVERCKLQLRSASSDLMSAHDKLKGGMVAVDFCVERVSEEKDIQTHALTQQCYSSALALPSTAIAKAVWDMQQSLRGFDKIAIRSKKALEELHTVEAEIDALKKKHANIKSLNDGQISSLAELINEFGSELERCRAGAKQFQQQLAEQIKKLKTIQNVNAKHGITAASSTPASANGVAQSATVAAAAAIGPFVQPPAAKAAAAAAAKAAAAAAAKAAAAANVFDGWGPTNTNDPFKLNGGRRSSPSRSKAARRKSKSRSPRSHRRIGRR